MKPGPAPAPTKLRMLRGNPSRRPLNKSEPRPKAKARTPSAPSHLGPDGRREWRRLAKELTALGLLTTLDMTAFRLYCDVYETYMDATATIRKFNRIIKTPNGFLVTSPYVHLANKALAQMNQLMQEFGMTPAARSRVEVGEKPTDQEELEEYLFGHRNAG